ncbi:MAG: PKD domain-containing protein [Saprospiraceae bacterium]
MVFSDDGSNATDDALSHIFNIPGWYSVGLIAQSNCLCADTSWMTIHVLSAENPSLSCVGTYCPGESAEFTLSDTDCTEIVWDVAGGTVLAGGGISDTFVSVLWGENTPNYISVSGQNCTAQECPEPTLFFIPVLTDDKEIKGPEKVCWGDEETYHIGPIDGVEIKWRALAGGEIVDEDNREDVLVHWNKVNTSVGKLEVEYHSCYLGCLGRDTIWVNILRPMGIFGPSEVCEGTSETFQAKASSSSVYSDWTLFDEDNQVAWASPSFGVQVSLPDTLPSGEYLLVAVPTGSGLNQTCSPKAEKRVSIRPKPGPLSGISGPTYFCPNKPQAFQALGGSTNALVQWNIKNSGSQSPYADQGNSVIASFQPGTPRWLEARQLSTDGLGCLSEPVHKDVFELPTIDLTGSESACDQSPASYSATAIPNFNYEWSVVPEDAGVLAIGQGTGTVVVFWKKPGMHAIRLSVCNQVIEKNVEVHPVSQVDMQDPGGVCQGSTLFVSGPPGFANYVWKDSLGMVVGGQNGTNLSAGNFVLEVEDNNGCWASTEFVVDEYPSPNVSLTTVDPTGFCDNGSYVQMTALVEEDGDFEFEWFQDGQALGVNQVQYVTNQYGSYAVQVSNQYGCIASDGLIDVFEWCDYGVCYNSDHPNPCPPGTIDLNILPTMVCDSFEFELIASSNYQPGTAYWEFGKSGTDIIGTAYEDNPTFVFPNAGKYLVILRIELQGGAGCVVIDSVDVEVYAQLAVLHSGCSNTAIEFHDESTFLPGAGISSWSWDFGDPASGAANQSSLRQSTHTYDQPGLYDLKLEITAPSGCKSFAESQVHVAPAPDVVFTLPPVSCEHIPLAFSSATLGSNLLATNWVFESANGGWNDTLSGAAVWEAFPEPGTYYITQTETNYYGCTGSYADSVVIHANQLSGNIEPNTYIVMCEGQEIVLEAPAGGVNYHWSDGSIGQELTVDEEGVYAVTVSDAYGCILVPTPMPVRVNPAPFGVIKALSFDENNQVNGVVYPELTICAGEPIHLFLQGGDFLMQWSDGTTDEELVFSEDRDNLPGPGSYSYGLTLTDPQSGCTSVLAEFPVQVNPRPAGFWAEADQFCAGTQSTVSIMGAIEPDWTVFWNNGIVAPSFGTSLTGRYYARVANPFGCSDTSNTVRILPGPNLSAIPGGCHKRCEPDTLCIPALPDIQSWQWYLNGAAIPGADSANLIVYESGDYWVEMVDTNGCSAQSDPFAVELFVGTGDVLIQVWEDVNDNGIVDGADTLVNGVPIWLNGLLFSDTIATSPVAGFGGIPSSQSYLAQIDTAFDNGLYEIIFGEATIDLVGCGRILQENFLINFKCIDQADTLPLLVCPGDSALYEGELLPAGFLNTFGYTTTLGCDSLVTVSVAELPHSSDTLEFAACPGTSISFGGVDIPVGDTQIFSYNNSQGCDSTITVSVTELPHSSDTLEFAACSGTSLSFDGVDVLAGDTQVFSYTNSLGCDSTITVSVTELPHSSDTLEFAACPGTSIPFDGVDVPAGTTQIFSYTNSQGCDSTLTVDVLEFPEFDTYEEYFICPGTVFEYQGQALMPDSMYSFHLQTNEGCDSIVEVLIVEYNLPGFFSQVENSCPNLPSGTISLSTTDTGGPFEYSLDGLVFQADSLFEDLESGSYSVWILDENQCIQQLDIEVESFGTFDVQLPEVSLSCDGSATQIEVELSGDISGVQLLWWNGATGLDTWVESIGPIWVEAENQCISIRREREVAYESGLSISNAVYLPNVIHVDPLIPSNAFFKPFFAEDVQVGQYLLEVFDRWGNMVFQTTNSEEGWNGDFVTRLTGPAVFVYRLEADLFICGEEIHLEKSGDITVIR